jgi:hypothetical protein
MVEIDIQGEEEAYGELEDLDFSMRLDEQMGPALEQAANVIRQWLVYYTPTRTGRTAASWSVIAVDRDDYYITNTNEPIITYLTEGTAPHYIAPVQAQALHWVENGQDYFSMGHMVSGIVGVDIEEQALVASEPELDNLFDMAVDAATRDALE